MSQNRAILKRRSAGYVLISVLVVMTLVTALIASVQSTARQTLSSLPVATMLADDTIELASILAIAPSLIGTEGPVLVDASGPWIEVVSRDGLVDLNKASEDMVLAVLQIEGINTAEPAQVLKDLRETNVTFNSVEEATRALGLNAAESERVARYYTLRGQASVNLDLVAQRLQATLSRAMARSATAPLTGALGSSWLVLTSDEKDGPFVRRFYYAVDSDADTYSEGLQRFIH